MHYCNHRRFGGRAHLLWGHDGSRRNRLILSRWYVELTIRGRYLNVGWM